MMDYSELIGKPYAEYGRGPDSYDCWGTVIAVGAKHGIAIPDYGHYYHADEYGILRECKKRRAEWLQVGPGEPLQVCDVVLFKRMNTSLHFGIVIEDGCFMQAIRDLGVHICRLAHPYYKQIIHGVYRPKQNV